MEFLPALGQREAIAFGEGVTLPVRIRFDELPKNALPRSSTARFSEQWQQSVGDEGFLDQIVERWRHSSSGSSIDQTQNTAMFAEAMGIQQPPVPHEGAQRPADHEPRGSAPAPTPTLRREPLVPRRDLREARPSAPPAQPAYPAAASSPAPASAPVSSPASFRSLRDRLNQRR
jgi:hypothetical protein